jgi:hypothetical protein
VCLLTATSAGTSEPLKMRASSHAPACLTVQFSVEPDPENRVLVVAARTPSFYRSSEMELDGARAPRTTVFQLRVPSDQYEVTGILVGQKGPKATARTMVRVLGLPSKSNVRCDAPASR